MAGPSWPWKAVTWRLSARRFSESNQPESDTHPYDAVETHILVPCVSWLKNFTTIRLWNRCNMCTSFFGAKPGALQTLFTLFGSRSSDVWTTDRLDLGLGILALLEQTLNMVLGRDWCRVILRILARFRELRPLLLFLLTLLPFSTTTVKEAH